MNEFTKAEIERINQLYGNDFKGITPDDAMLIGRFEANKALQDEEFKTKMQLIKNESEQRMKQSELQHNAAMNNLEYLHAKAVSKWERVENGQ